INEFNKWIPRAKQKQVLGGVHTLFGPAGKHKRLSVLEKWRQSKGVLVLGYPLLRAMLAPPNPRPLAPEMFTAVAAQPREANGTTDRLMFAGAGAGPATEDAKAGGNDVAELSTAGMFTPSAEYEAALQHVEQLREYLIDPGPAAIVCDEGHT
ncbi:hypothetical protein HK405_001163, partial [Cladochytrium tenue]